MCLPSGFVVRSTTSYNHEQRSATRRRGVSKENRTCHREPTDGTQRERRTRTMTGETASSGQRALDRSTNIAPVPENLDASGTKLVYFALHVEGPLTAAELRERLDVPLLALYPHLETLTERGFVERDGEQYVPSPERR